jgi:hypothetical protein
MAGGWLIWVKGAKGPSPSKWAEPPAMITDFWRGRVLSKVAISEADFALSLDELAAKFPPPPAEVQGERYVIARRAAE